MTERRSVSGNSDKAYLDKDFQLKIAHLNLNGWTTNNGELRQELLKYTNADFIGVNETHLRENDCLVLEDYKFINHCRKRQHIRAVRAFGGVGMFVKNYILEEFSVEIFDKTYDGILAMKFTHVTSDFSMVIIVGYLAPENSKFGRDANGFFSHITSLLYQCVNTDLTIIAGDLNARVGNRCDIIESLDDIRKRKSIDEVLNQHGHSLLEFMKESRLCILNGRFDPSKDGYTSISTKGTAVVDYLLSPIDNLKMFQTFEVDSCATIVQKLKLGNLLSKQCKIPDHAIISATFNIKICLNTEEANLTSLSNSKPRFKLTNIPNSFMDNADVIIKLIDDILAARHTQEHVDNTYEKLINTVLDEMYEKLQYLDNNKRKDSGYSKPFWNDELQSLYNDSIRIERIYKKCKLRSERRDIRLQFKRSRHDFDKVFRKYERQYRREQSERIEKACSSEPQRFWRDLKNVGSKRSNVVPMEVYDETDNILCDVTSVKDVWKQSFEKIYNEGLSDLLNSSWGKELLQLIKAQEDVMQDAMYEPCEQLNNDITINEVRAAAMKIKPRKAVGIDLLPNEIIKNHNLAEVLQVFFQTCFDRSIVPTAWRQAIIKPIPKSSEDDNRIPSNYRGISLLSCVSKLFTKILSTRLTTYLDDRGGLVEEQNGFRTGRSCTEHIFTLQSVIQSRQCNNLSTFVTFIDFSKAFDRINRESLLYKLFNNPCPIDGKMYSIIKTLYTDTESCININEYRTDWFETLQGVRQGDNLSPTLFAVFVNDLAVRIKEMNIGVKMGEIHIPILLYADDVAILSETEADMQTMLNCINEWCEKWSMSVNLKKTQTVHYRKPTMEHTDTKLYFGNNEIKFVQFYKYLGVYFDEYLNFDKHKDEVSQSGFRALGSLIQKYKTLECMGHSSYKKYFESCVWPVINYGAEVWGYSNYNAINSVQIKAIKIFLGVHKFAANLAVTGDTGWVPCEIKQNLSLLRLWNKLIKLEDSRLPKMIFNYIREFKCTKWIKKIGEINEVLDLQLSDSALFNTKECEIKLMREFQTQWKLLLPNKPKLRTYRQFKSDYSTESYVTLNLNRTQRSMLAQLRFGILPLHIETGRFVGTAEANRICKLCDNGDIENEAHFTFQCSKYRTQRADFLNIVNSRHPNFENLNDCDKFSLLFESEPRLFSKFVTTIFSVRQNCLYNN